MKQNADIREGMLSEVYRRMDDLIGYAIRHLDLDPRDVDWKRNHILALFNLDSYVPQTASQVKDGTQNQEAEPGKTTHEDDESGEVIDNLIEAFCQAIEDAGLPGSETPLTICDQVMDILSQPPSALQDRFEQVQNTDGGMAAMHWFYGYCVDNTYIKKARLLKNPRFESHGLIVTINLAKPEFKDMRKAAVGNRVQGGYPSCTICHQNEGFAGRNKRTLRTIPLTLGSTPWFWQFSPYGYFDQHGICVNALHQPMRVDRSTFGNLLDFVDRFPGYFLGCNAALPRIGGSVLAHDHYQGGGEMLPLHRAAAWLTMKLEGHPDTQIEILDWPGTAMRVVSSSREEIIEVSDRIRCGWVTYNNEDLNIACDGPDGKQSALSPSAVITKRGYEMNLILRNNAVSSELPDGIFHIDPRFYPIKQEPIGLIEAQGLFVLPGRLMEQLGLIRDALVTGQSLPSQVEDFRFVWDELNRILVGRRDSDTVEAAIREELGDVCSRILENTAVFKNKESSRSFMESLGFVSCE